jgi:hypothetical protein
LQAGDSPSLTSPPPPPPASCTGERLDDPSPSASDPASGAAWGRGVEFLMTAGYVHTAVCVGTGNGYWYTKVACVWVGLSVGVYVVYVGAYVCARRVSAWAWAWVWAFFWRSGLTHARTHARTPPPHHTPHIHANTRARTRSTLKKKKENEVSWWTGTVFEVRPGLDALRV